MLCLLQPAVSPLPGSLPTEHVCLPTAQPSVRLQFHPTDTQQPLSLITALHRLQGMGRTVAQLLQQIRCPLGKPNVHQHVNNSPSRLAS